MPLPLSRLLTAAALAGVLVAAPSAASADIFVSPFLGVKFKGSTNQITFDNANGARDVKPAVGIAAAVLSDAGLGFEVDLAHQSRFFESGDDILVTRSGVTTLSGNVMLALPVSITRESLRPYAAAGLGWMHSSLRDQIALSPVNNDFLVLSLGGGAIGFLSDVVGLRFDLRYLKSVSSSDTSAVNQDLARLSFWRATLGIVFR